MAGEIQEPLRFNFQADLLQSGSISFGRFESESLSWEKRSSFSHNRYLEEVEKFSKPGSVTEKKAYFEAHFRRKALLKQSSSESQTVDSDDPQDLENDNDVKHYTCFDHSPRSSGHLNNDEETDIQECLKENVETLCFEDGNASNHITSTNFDESLCDLSYEGGEVIEHEREELEVFSAGPNDESMLTTVDHMAGPQSGTENVVLVKSEGNIDSESVDSRFQRKLPSKVRPASDAKQPKTKSKAQTSFSCVQRIVPGETPNPSAKSKTRESKGLLIKEKEKKSSRPATPVAHSVRKTPKPEESSMSSPKVKILPPSKSIVKEYRSEKTMETTSPVTEKSLRGARQTVNRSTHPVITPSKPHVNQSAAGFTFRSNQQTDKRKEDKRVAEITRSQKRLNFKATPMPSFYKESTRSSDQNKVISTNKTPSRPRTTTMTPHTNIHLSNSTTSSTPRPSSSTSFTNRNRPTEPSRRVQEKKKDSSLHEQNEPEATKGPRARDTLRRTSPRLGYLAVSVAT